MIQLSKGFTLVELIVVLAIIGLLVVLVLITINPATVGQRTRDAARISDLLSLQQAIESFAVDNNGTLPDAGAQSVTRQSNILPEGSAGPLIMPNGQGWISQDMSKHFVKLPVDPLNQTFKNILYVYRYRQNGLKYKIDAVFEYAGNADLMKNDGGTDDVHYERGTELGIAM